MKKVIAGMLVMVLLLTVCIDWRENKQTAETKAEAEVEAVVETAEDIVTLSGPKRVSDDSLESGKKVIWDCVYFGSYPQAEVVSKAISKDYNIPDKYLESGDLIIDNELYERLQSGTGWDDNGDITLDGIKYRRMKKMDATGDYYEKCDTNYYWSDYTTYHYFRYEPIKWRVLSTDGSKALLLSDRLLDCQIYHDAKSNTWPSMVSAVWESCTLRSWMNGYGAAKNSEGKDYSSKNFIDTAFNSKEQAVIADTALENADNLTHKTKGGNNTTDKIFCLSETDVHTEAAKAHGFPPSRYLDDTRIAFGTSYARAMGCFMYRYSDSESSVEDGASGWWLRTPGSFNYHAMYVYPYGHVGNELNDDDWTGVRVALNLQLNTLQDMDVSGLYSYAGTVSEVTDYDEAEQEEPEPIEFTVETGEKISSLLSAKIDTSKQSVGTLSSLDYASLMRKGDDGSCYYFRNRGKGKKEKLVFYKDNGKKVCETTVKKSFKKNRYYIQGFAKYGNRFFLVFWSPRTMKTILTSVQITTGKWSKLIKASSDIENVMVYKDCFYCTELYDEDGVTIYNLSGAKKETGKLTKNDAKVQCIVDDKMYYLTETKKTVKVMRCSLNGRNKEKLFQYQYEGESAILHAGLLKIDGNYMYLSSDDADNSIICIPLYGGKIKKITHAGGYFDLTDNNIFFYGNEYIYKTDKKLTEQPKAVTKFYHEAYYSVQGDIYSYPFLCADSHLLVRGYKKKEYKVIGKLLGEYGSWSDYIDITVNYADDFYRMTEDGEMEATIKGSGVKKWS